MCQPERPSPDHYDTNAQVKAHFAKTPGLTLIPRGHFYRETAESVRRDVRNIYRTHGLNRCPHHGLYWAGSKRWTSLPDRDKTMLLVIELSAQDITRWREIDADARLILTSRADLRGVHGVCVRYYQHWRDDTDSDSDNETNDNDNATNDNDNATNDNDNATNDNDDATNDNDSEAIALSDEEDDQRNTPSLRDFIRRSRPNARRLAAASATVERAAESVRSIRIGGLSGLLTRIPPSASAGDRVLSNYFSER
ncbi:hypothetical protein LTR36_007951 [Oleoguttula mirabilis]|uniref:Uncharacterized protein n=1 Tax=Oleoguttula mirabilis TaxID=1507867 RepID=A0AAV9J951_9PEZI|nr:hypothetical protein LTR36_007951 [Oleoguttula mirabilis]